MEEFHLESFVAEPTLRSLSLLKKPQLIEVANHYELSVVSSMKKGEIKRLITTYLIDEELVPEEDIEGQLSSSVDSSSLELKRLEFQKQEKARELSLS